MRFITPIPIQELQSTVFYYPFHDRILKIIHSPNLLLKDGIARIIPTLCFKHWVPCRINVQLLVSFHFTLTFNFVYKNMNITKHSPFSEQHFYKFWFHYVGFFGAHSWQYWESTNTILGVLF